MTVGTGPSPPSRPFPAPAPRRWRPRAGASRWSGGIGPHSLSTSVCASGVAMPSEAAGEPHGRDPHPRSARAARRGCRDPRGSARTRARRKSLLVHSAPAREARPGRRWKRVRQPVGRHVPAPRRRSGNRGRSVSSGHSALAQQALKAARTGSAGPVGSKPAGSCLAREPDAGEARGRGRRSSEPPSPRAAGARAEWRNPAMRNARVPGGGHGGGSLMTAPRPATAGTPCVDPRAARRVPAPLSAHGARASVRRHAPLPPRCPASHACASACAGADAAWLPLPASADFRWLTGGRARATERLVLLAVPERGDPWCLVPRPEAEALAAECPWLDLEVWDEHEDPLGRLRAGSSSSASPPRCSATAFCTGPLLTLAAAHLVPAGDRRSPRCGPARMPTSCAASAAAGRNADQVGGPDGARSSAPGMTEQQVARFILERFDAAGRQRRVGDRRRRPEQRDAAPHTTSPRPLARRRGGAARPRRLHRGATARTSPAPSGWRAPATRRVPARVRVGQRRRARPASPRCAPGPRPHRWTWRRAR